MEKTYTITLIPDPETILDLLADAEAELFHASTDNPENQHLRNAASAARQALEEFARAIGKIH